MPDLATHLLAGCFTPRPRRLRVIFFVGLALPDILGRMPMVFWKPSYWFINPFHTPIGVALAAYLIAFLFEPSLRPRVFGNLMAGSGIHLFLDLLQRHITPAYYWFFPFTWKTFEIPLFWPEQSIWALPFILVLAIAVAIGKKARQGRPKRFVQRHR